MMFRRLTIAICGIQIVMTPIASRDGVWAADKLMLPEEINVPTRGNEYISGNYPGAVLMPVNLWGAVLKPGIHHIPNQTDLMTLLSYAGGPVKDADMSEVLIKRKGKDLDQVLEVDLRKMISRPDAKRIALEPNDIVLIPQKEEMLSDNTLKTVTFISAILGIVATSFLISERLRK